MVLARSTAMAPISTFLAGGAPASGLPSQATAAPQPAMPQEGAAAAVASNPLLASWNQHAGSSAPALVNSACAAGLHDVGKFTVPSFSVEAPVRATSNTSTAAMADTRIVILLPCTGQGADSPFRSRHKPCRVICGRFPAHRGR